MSEGLNDVTLFGNLGADPEYRVTQGGTGVLRLRLATTEGYLDRNKVRQERTEWHSVTIWGRRAEALSRFLAKGQSILVKGAIRTSNYEDREGQKRYRTEVVASNIILATRGSQRRTGSQPSGGERYDDNEPADNYSGDLPGADDDIPF